MVALCLSSVVQTLENMERVSASTFSMPRRGRRRRRHVALGFDFDFDWSITAYGLATQAASSSISSGAGR